jgi:hypothetical protein
MEINGWSSISILAVKMKNGKLAGKLYKTPQKGKSSSPGAIISSDTKSPNRSVEMTQSSLTHNELSQLQWAAAFSASDKPRRFPPPDPGVNVLILSIFSYPQNIGIVNNCFSRKVF